MDLPHQLRLQFKGIGQLINADIGAILFRHPSIEGILNLVVECYRYTLEFIVYTLLCLGISEPAGKARLWLIL